MKPEDIHFGDLHRIFIGEVPGAFYIELIFRALLVYLLLITAMRLMGKRMASQIGRTEMAAVASLAAAVGIPLMNPDKGVLPAVVIALVIVALQVWIARRSSRNEKFESLSQDKISTLVKDGVLELTNLKKTRITRERLFAQLRTLKQTNLGNVKRLYLEANGLFSLVEMPKPIFGLSILPESDQAFISKLEVDQESRACYNCGNLTSANTSNTDICQVCQSKKWTDAVK